MKKTIVFKILAYSLFCSSFLFAHPGFGSSSYDREYRAEFGVIETAATPDLLNSYLKAYCYGAARQAMLMHGDVVFNVFDCEDGHAEMRNKDGELTFLVHHVKLDQNSDRHVTLISGLKNKRVNGVSVAHFQGLIVRGIDE